ncbi:MAG: DUF3800 domain-containing protein [Verrucomicrobia bacterium]|nr:DUF3800 domain-containing protein [Verrucomicrobiota bacterium]
MNRHRLYFDESGVHSYQSLDSVHRRYLALCGVVFEDEEYRRFQERWEAMKRSFFRGDPDEPIVLHRKELMARSGIFGVLEDEAKRAEFDAAFLEIVRATPFVGLIVVIDKASHLGQYSDPVNPYHFCLVALLQRYCFWLGSRRGDVMGESRGKVEDQQLKAAYEALYAGGDWHNDADFYQARLTSREIKLRPKHKNIAGLQLADLLAHPCKHRCLINHGVVGVTESPFGKQVADLYWQKLRKRRNGVTKEWGEIFIG